MILMKVTLDSLCNPLQSFHMKWHVFYLLPRKRAIYLKILHKMRHYELDFMRIVTDISITNYKRFCNQKIVDWTLAILINDFHVLKVGCNPGYVRLRDY